MPFATRLKFAVPLGCILDQDETVDGGRKPQFITLSADIKLFAAKPFCACCATAATGANAAAPATTHKARRRDRERIGRKNRRFSGVDRRTVSRLSGGNKDLALAGSAGEAAPAARQGSWGEPPARAGRPSPRQASDGAVAATR